MNTHPIMAQAQALEMFAPPPSLTTQFLALLESGHQLSALEAEQLAFALHAATVDMPEFEWMDKTFEDLGDSIHAAIENAKACDPTSDDSFH